MRKEYHKLVRDRIPEIVRADHLTPTTRILEDHEYVVELCRKLIEEAKEVGGAQADAKELVKEIGDMYEVIDALIAQLGVDREEITKLQAERREKRGGFSKKIFLEHVE